MFWSLVISIQNPSVPVPLLGGCLISVFLAAELPIIYNWVLLILVLVVEVVPSTPVILIDEGVIDKEFPPDDAAFNLMVAILELIPVKIVLTPSVIVFDKATAVFETPAAPLTRKLVPVILVLFVDEPSDPELTIKFGVIVVD